MGLLEYPKLLSACNEFGDYVNLIANNVGPLWWTLEAVHVPESHE